MQAKRMKSITEEPHKITRGQAVMVGEEEELSDEGMQEQQACVVSSPVVMLGSCLVSFFTLFMCRVRLNQRNHD